VRRRRQAEIGAALVEFAAAVTLLLLLLLGILEFGLLFKDLLILHEAARVGARSAGLGNTTDTITSRTQNSAISLNAAAVSVDLRYSTDGGASFPEVLSDSGGENDAPVGSLIRLTASYPHRYVTGFVVPGQQSKTLVARMVSQREYASAAGGSSGGGGGGGKGGGKSLRCPSRRLSRPDLPRKRPLGDLRATLGCACHTVPGAAKHDECETIRNR